MSITDDALKMVRDLGVAADNLDKIEARVQTTLNELTAEVNTLIQEAPANFPVTPNQLADSKYFASLCDGEGNVEKELFEAHSSSGIFSCFWHNGGTGSGTVERVSLDRLGAKGMPHGGELSKACAPNFSGSDFITLLFDVTIDSSNEGTPSLFVLNQGCPSFTGWSKGHFKTQASCFVNVLEHSGDIKFYPHANMSAYVSVTGPDAGQGWLYKHNSRKGWGGCHQPRFAGRGHMRVALALPYIGFGDHKGLFVHANSVGRYSHGGDRLAAGEY